MDSHKWWEVGGILVPQTGGEWEVGPLKTDGRWEMGD